MYKVVAFKGVRDPDKVILRNTEDQKVNDSKLESNMSRARSTVLQYALCNSWDYFFTCTLNGSWHDRYSLPSFTARLPQFIRDMRKVYESKIQYLLVPQAHEDGAWHMHGFLSNLPDDRVCEFDYTAPWTLRSKGYLNWPDYASKFGHCSLSRLNNAVAASYYILRYIERDMANRASDLGQHLYFHSRPLNKAVKASDVYLPSPELDAVCIEKYKFCSVGMVQGVDWYYPYNFPGAVECDVDLTGLFTAEPITQPLANFDPSTIDPDYEQITFDGFQFIDSTDAFI